MKIIKKKKIFAEKKARRCWNIFSPLFWVKVKPYLSANEIALAITNCCHEFFRVTADGTDDLTRYDLFENVRIAFDVVVLTQCTDINTKGLKWDDLVGGGAMEAIRKKVKNYDMAWSLACESLNLKNTYSGLNLIARMIPNPEAMQKNIKDMAEQIDAINSKNPEGFKKVLETAVNIEGFKAAREVAKKDKNAE